MPVYPTGTPTFPLCRPVYPDRAPDTAGTGVKPDIAVPADEAPTAAHLDALERRLRASPGKRSSP